MELLSLTLAVLFVTTLAVIAVVKFVRMETYIDKQLDEINHIHHLSEEAFDTQIALLNTRNELLNVKLQELDALTESQKKLIERSNQIETFIKMNGNRTNVRDFFGKVTQ